MNCDSFLLLSWNSYIYISMPTLPESLDLPKQIEFSEHMIDWKLNMEFLGYQANMDTSKEHIILIRAMTIANIRFLKSHNVDLITKEKGWSY